MFFSKIRGVSDFPSTATLQYTTSQPSKLGAWRVWMEASPINDAQTAICSAASLFLRARSDVNKGCVGQTYPTEHPPFWFIEKFFYAADVSPDFFLTTCQRCEIELLPLTMINPRILILNLYTCEIATSDLYSRTNWPYNEKRFYAPKLVVHRKA